MAKATTQNKATKVEKVETKTEPVVESKPVETKKGASKKATKEEVSAPTPAPAPVPEVVQETKKGGSKKATKEVEPTPVPEPVKETKKGGSKKATKEVEPEPAPAPAPEPVKETKKGGSKKSSKKAKEPEPEPEPVQEGEQEGEQVKAGHRFFRCVFKNTDGEIVHAGRYSGKKPKQAARKALTGIVKKNQLEVGERVIFLIQECTRGSKKKKYSYVGAQVNLPEPISVTIRKKDGQKSEIVYTKDNEVKKISLSECGDLLDVVMEEDGPEVAPVRLQRKPAKKATKKPSKKTTKEVKVEEVPVKEEPKKVKATKSK